MLTWPTLLLGTQTLLHEYQRSLLTSSLAVFANLKQKSSQFHFLYHYSLRSHMAAKIHSYKTENTT